MFVGATVDRAWLLLEPYAHWRSQGCYFSPIAKSAYERACARKKRPIVLLTKGGIVPPLPPNPSGLAAQISATVEGQPGPSMPHTLSMHPMPMPGSAAMAPIAATAPGPEGVTSGSQPVPAMCPAPPESASAPMDVDIAPLFDPAVNYGNDMSKLYAPPK